MTKLYSLRLAVLLILAFLTSGLKAQINTPAGAVVPFGSNTSYSYGIMPTNLPTGGTYGKSQDAADAYNEWKTNYIEYCNSNTQARVRFDDISKTVSEGVAYGMLLSAYAADQTLFNKLWAYYKANSNGNGIMNWKINGCSGVNGSNGATDAELDAAMALLIAENQWPTATTPYDYGTEATNLITSIKANEMHPSSYQAVNGDGWGFGNSCRNPSYQAPAYYQAFGNHVASQATFWSNAVTAAYSLINSNANSSTGLVSNWSDNNGSANSCNGPNEYGFDACRNPWRMATDAIWNNSTNGKNICAKIASYVSGQGASNVKGPRNQNGTGGGYHNAVFVSTYATALVGTSATYQTLLNQMYTETKNTKDAYSTGYPSGYFGNTLRTLSLFVMTGNFWKPGTQAAQEINVTVSGVDVPSGSTYDFQNVQNNTGKVVTFTIENKGSAALTLSGSPKITISGTNQSMFVINQSSVSSSLSGGATTTFTITFTPTSSGLKTAQISIASNDADGNPYSITLNGTGTVSATNPEIAISQNSVNINTGGAFNFGDVTNNASYYITFTIDNSGNAPLNITSVTVSAGQGYTLDQTAGTPVAAGSSTTFRVKFTPGSSGTKTGTITIANNDPDEGSFVINLTGNGVPCQTSMTNTGVIQDYDANNNVVKAFPPVGALDEAFANPHIDATNPSATVAQYQRLATGTYDVIRYNRCNSTNFSISASKPLISFLIYSPVAGKNVILSMKNVSNGSVKDVTVQTTKSNQWERLYFDFTSIVGNSTVYMFDIMIDPTPAPGVARTYYIDDIRFDTNPCITDLPASEIFNDYDNHRNVALAFNPNSPLNQVYANPFSTGLNTSATVAKFDRNGTNTYDVIRYAGCSNSVDLTGKTTISLLIYSPVAGADVILSMKTSGGVEVAAVTTKTTVANQWQRLYFDFSSIANNSTVGMFDIMIDPLIAQGARTYYIDEIKYDVNPCYSGISSSGVMQDYDLNRFLDLDAASEPISDLFANPSAVAPNTSATVAKYNRPAIGTYRTIRYKPCGSSFDLSPGKTVYSMQIYSPSANTPVTMALKKADGTTDLVNVTVNTTVANSWETLTFDFSSAMNSTLGAYLDIMIDTAAAKGAATYYIDNIQFSTGIPEINVQTGTTDIASGGSFNMGTIAVGSSSSTISFLIQNNGSADLSLTGTPKIAISGTNSSEFTIDQSVITSPVGAVSTTSFTVTFTPTSGGAKTAQISIANNDSNENPYIINLTGTGTCPAPTTSNAGPDQTVCAPTATLAGNTPTVGTGAWSVVSGTATITTTSSPASGVTGLVAGATATLRWTITNGACGSSTDDVVITTSANPTTSNAGSDQTVCAATATLAGNNPSVGTGAWSVVSGPGSVTTPSSRTSGVTGLVAGSPTTFRWTITGTCSNSTDDVVITRDAAPTTSNAGPDQTVCAASATLAGNNPATGTGTWSLVSGTANITTPTSRTSGITGLVAGASATLRWTISNGVCTSSTNDVVITRSATPTTSNAGPDQSVCATSTTLAGNTPTNGTGTWTVVSGTGTFGNANSPTSTVSGLSTGTNTLRWTIANSPCTATTDDVVITVSGGITTANAGPNQTVCASTATLAGNSVAGGETGTWSVVSGTATISSANSPTSGITGLVAGGTVTLRWSIDNGSCTPSTDDVVITRSAAPTTSNAGSDQSVCGTSATLAGNTATTGSGTWTVISGTGTFANANSPTSGVTGLSTGTNTFRWTITNSPCTASTDDVVITSVTSPTTANAGTDQSLCAVTTATLAGNTASTGTGTWTVISGTGTFANANSPTSGVTGLSTGTNTFRWSITNSPCTASTDDIIITVSSAPTTSNAGSDQSVCASSATLAGNTPSTGTGTWTVVSGTGTFSNANSPTSSVTGLTTGTNTLRWTISNGSCTASTDDVVITVTGGITTANAGPDQNITLPSNSATLAANSVAGGESGTWSVVSGTATITSASSPTSTVTGLGTGVNVLRWTISNGSCSPSTDDVTINVGSVPSSQTISGPTTVSGGQTGVTYSVPAPSSGSTYNWSLPPGSTITSASADSSTITVDFGNTSGNVVLTETNPFGTTNSTLPITVGTTGYMNQVLSSALKVNPNPAQGLFVVSFNSAFNGPATVNVRNALGKIVYSDHVNSTNSTDHMVDLQDLPGGVYMLEVETEQGIAVKRLVKQ